MKSRKYLEYADVERVAAAAIAEASKNAWIVTIAITDEGGHLLWLGRLDGASPLSAQIAPAKARTAALGRRASKAFEEIINQGRYAFLSAPGLDGMLEGGVPIRVDGEVVGAIGVSGVKSAEDAQIAQAGAAVIDGT